MCEKESRMMEYCRHGTLPIQSNHMVDDEAASLSLDSHLIGLSGTMKINAEHMIETSEYWSK